MPLSHGSRSSSVGDPRLKIADKALGAAMRMRHCDAQREAGVMVTLRPVHRCHPAITSVPSP